MEKTNNKIPLVKWAQRRDQILITFDVIREKNEISSIVVLQNRIKFELNKESTLYEVEFNLYHNVNTELYVFKSVGRKLFLVLNKIDNDYWPYLTKTRLNYVVIDWDLWQNEDELNMLDKPNIPDESYFPKNSFNYDDFDN